MRIFISTGEVSGDLQGSLLVAALRRQSRAGDLAVEIVALGGEKMAAAGAMLLGNTSEIGSFGLLESLPFVLPTLRLQRRAIAYLKENSPDLVVLIDYMGPNLAIGSYIRRHFPHVPIVYYIAPQVWASSVNLGNASRIASVSDKLLTIFPEETRYFQNKGVNAIWVGHPLLDRKETFPTKEAARAQLKIEDEAIAIAIIPASRHQELKYLLPVMFQAAREIQTRLPKVHFWIPLSLKIYQRKIEQEIQRYGLRATVVSDQQQQILAAADVAITKCGTVNLELALLNVPQVVVYRLNSFTYWVARKILKISFPFASPVNLMVMKQIVPEFIQQQATAENIIRTVMEFVLVPERRQKLQVDYQKVQQCMGDVGVCDRAAKEILKMLPNSKF